jgi:hypothetical protein
MTLADGAAMSSQARQLPSLGIQCSSPRKRVRNRGPEETLSLLPNILFAPLSAASPPPLTPPRPSTPPTFTRTALLDRLAKEILRKLNLILISDIKDDRDIIGHELFSDVTGDLDAQALLRLECPRGTAFYTVRTATWSGDTVVHESVKGA